MDDSNQNKVLHKRQDPELSYRIIRTLSGPGFIGFLGL
jgi:hypothetical protein